MVMKFIAMQQFQRPLAATSSSGGSAAPLLRPQHFTHVIRGHKSHGTCCHANPTSSNADLCSGGGRAGAWMASLTACAATAATLLLAAGPAVAADSLTVVDPVYDGAAVLREADRAALSSRISELESRTGFAVRVFSQYALDASPEGPSPRKIWGSLGKRTVVVRVDPSSPNILSVPYIGDDVLTVLRRPFWIELESRFGNLFYVREQGEAAAVMGALAALTDCLGRDGGCAVVPGLPPEQYTATLVCAATGGLVAGFVGRIEPQGIVQRRWVWLLLFSPLWGSLFVSFGLGPILTRTGDVAPLIANTAAFLVAAVAPTALQRLWDGRADSQGGGGTEGGP